MEWECNGYTEELQREVTKDYRVIFNPESKEYEVMQYLPKEDRETCILIVDSWSRAIVNDLRMFHYESHDGFTTFEEYMEKITKPREAAEKTADNRTEDECREVAHSWFHMAKKRVW